MRSTLALLLLLLHIKPVYYLSVVRLLAMMMQCWRYFSFTLPSFEYCMPIWLSTAECHLKLLDHATVGINVILSNLNINLERRRTLGCLSFLYKILHNPYHPLYAKLPGPFIHWRVTRFSISLNDRIFAGVKCKTQQFFKVLHPKICKI